MPRLGRTFGRTLWSLLAVLAAASVLAPAAVATGASRPDVAIAADTADTGVPPARTGARAGAAAGASAGGRATVDVTAKKETRPVANADDAADDPAIWVDRKNAARSVVIGTDKAGALEVYDLAGRRIQRIGRGPFDVGGAVEGCVADDRSGQLFIDRGRRYGT